MVLDIVAALRIEVNNVKCYKASRILTTSVPLITVQVVVGGGLYLPHRKVKVHLQSPTKSFIANPTIGAASSVICFNLMAAVCYQWLDMETISYVQNHRSFYILYYVCMVFIHTHTHNYTWRENGNEG
jgi:hypothetical protein